MSEPDAKNIVSRLFLERWNQKKTCELDQYISKDNVITGLLATGPAGPIQYKRFMESWHIGFPDFRYHIEAIIAEDDLVSVRTIFTGTHEGPFLLNHGLSRLPAKRSEFLRFSFSVSRTAKSSKLGPHGIGLAFSRNLVPHYWCERSSLNDELRSRSRRCRSKQTKRSREGFLRTLGIKTKPMIWKNKFRLIAFITLVLKLPMRDRMTFVK